MVINENVNRKILPVASGKGGVGKTVIAANLALSLAQNGKRTIVVDLDLGGSNLHTFLGIKNTNSGIGNFLSGMRGTLKDIIVQTPYENLSFIPGDVLVSNVSNLQFSQKKRLLSNILELDADYIILDLCSGSTFTVIDFFLISNSGLVVSTSQTTAVLNAYSLMKNIVVRFLLRICASHKSVTKSLQKTLKEKQPNAAPTLQQIIEIITKISPEVGAKAERYLSVLQPKMIINMAEKPEDLAIGEKLRDLIRENLNVEIECMGLIYFDRAVRASMFEHTPLLIYDNSSIASREIDRIAQKILQSENFPKMPLDFNYYKDSFELALIEAQNDYEQLVTARIPEGDESINVDELITLISAQKKKIEDLSTTIRMLTMRDR